ncbi:acyltransferase [Rhizobium sp. LC145]|uniref:acyltransferase family protein n=1 Tax=Rhizobium sp. LC145 TaxID=1120688 RepID=UPI000B337E99|nr:acyltransferase [Rhizobium sp. LC145]
MMIAAGFRRSFASEEQLFGKIGTQQTAVEAHPNCKPYKSGGAHMMASKDTEHYIALDGVRGVAAISVLFFHLGRWLDLPWLATNGNLAVDTFFTLSGFVLASAYAEKMHRLSLWDFVLIRAIRLMPVIVLATVISALYVLARSLLTQQGILLSDIAVAATLGILNAPYFYAPHHLGGPQLFPLNGPQFSLFLEVASNVFWWTCRFLNQVVFAVAAGIVSAISLVFMGIGGDTTETFWHGFPHVGSSFFIGILLFYIHRNLAAERWSVYFKTSFWILISLMMIMFYTPVEASFSAKLIWKLLLAPALVLAGPHVDLTAFQRSLSKYSGDISFPIYALHYPIFCWVNGIYQMLLGSRNPHFEIPLVTLAVVLTSHFALRLYDKPLRYHLSQAVRAGKPPPST